MIVNYITKYRLALALLYFVPLISYGQFSTDERLIDENMRYSKEKEFNNWAISIGLGPMISYTDLTHYVLFPDKNWKFAPNIIVSRQFGPVFAVDAQMLKGDLYGSKGDFYFRGDSYDYSFSGVMFLNQLLAFPGPINDRWDYYVKIGAGVTAFRSKMYHEATDKVVLVSDLMEGGSEAHISELRNMVLGYDLFDPSVKKARQHEVFVPIGLGMLYRVNNQIDLGLESTFRYMIEDNLDNILSGSLNDRYWYTSFNLAFKIGKSNTRHTRWTYRNYGFNIFGAPKKDPLLDEVIQLEEQVKQYADARPIKHDTLFIINTLIKKYGPDNTTPVFFDEGKSILDTQAKIDLAEVAVLLIKNPAWKIHCVGNADEKGTAAQNLELSRIRAEACMRYLIADLGISASRITIEQRGDSDLISPTNELSPRGIKMVNRRVDVILNR